MTVNYASDTMKPVKISAGRLDTFIDVYYPSGKDEFGQSSMQVMFRTRANIRVLSSDDATNLERVVEIVTRLGSMKPLLDRNPEKAIVKIEGTRVVYVDIKDLLLSGQYAVMSGTSVSEEVVA